MNVNIFNAIGMALESNNLSQVKVLLICKGLSELDRSILQEVEDKNDFTALNIHKSLGLDASCRFMELCNNYANNKLDDELQQKLVEITNDEQYQKFYNWFEKYFENSDLFEEDLTKLNQRDNTLKLAHVVLNHDLDTAKEIDRFMLAENEKVVLDAILHFKSFSIDTLRPSLNIQQVKSFYFLAELAKAVENKEEEVTRILMENIQDNIVLKPYECYN